MPIDHVKRDQQVIDLVDAGQTTRQIVEQLGLHIRTVQRIRKAHGKAGPHNSRLQSIDVAERNQKIVAMSREKHKVADIAAAFNITTRTVERIRKQHGVAGICRAPWSSMTPDEIRTANELLQDGCPYTEVAATLGRHVDTISKRFPGKGWEPTRGWEMKQMNQLLQQCGSRYGIK